MGEIAPEEQFLLLSTIFCYLMLDFYVKTRIRFSLRDKRLFEITGVEITRVDCNIKYPGAESVSSPFHSQPEVGKEQKPHITALIVRPHM